MLFTEEATKVELCKLTLNEEDVKRLRDAIEDLYYYEIVIGKPLTYNLINLCKSISVGFTWIVDLVCFCSVNVHATTIGIMHCLKFVIIIIILIIFTVCKVPEVQIRGTHGSDVS